MKNYSINVIGCGRLGKAIIFLLKGKIKINCILNQSLQSSVTACEFIGEGTPLSTYCELTAANLYLIATPDDQISKACKNLAATNLLRPGDIVFHCSGSLSSEILSSVGQSGALIASIHPLLSFANPRQSAANFSGTFCAVEGQPEAVKILTGLFQSIGARVFQIENSFKATYHAASCIASNYLVTLSHVAFTCYTQAGLPDELAKEVVNNMMAGVLKNLTHFTHAQALTGPIQRGDIGTVASHMKALKNNEKEVYSLLGKHTLALTLHNQKVTEDIIHALEQ